MRLPLGLVFVAAVVTRRSEEEAAELFRGALAAEPVPPPARRPPRGERPRRERPARRPQ